MCGIVSIWNRDGRPVDVPALVRAVAMLERRGPDDEGYLLIDTRSGRRVECRGPGTRADVDLPPIQDFYGQPFDLAFGHRRLAIVDLTAQGHQPMSSRDGQGSITFNGMIYNHHELRERLAAAGRTTRGHCDTEVLVEALSLWGDTCLPLLNGMWAFAHWDQTRRVLTWSRDRLGIKPLVYSVSDSQAACASDINSLRALGVDPGGLDSQALHHYLSLMQVPAPFTIYERIKKQLPATSLQITATDARESTYWNLYDFANAPRIAAADAPDQIEELLRDSVRLRLQGDVPVGCLLSGGVDSSLVSALAAGEVAPEALRTYSVVLPGSAEHDEGPWSRLVSTHLGTDHHEVIPNLGPTELQDLLSLFGEPFAVSSVLGVYLIAREARRTVKVLLSGDGGDEVFGGYARYRLDPSRISSRVARRIGIGLPPPPGQSTRWSQDPALSRIGKAVGYLLTGEEMAGELRFQNRRMRLNDTEKWDLYTPAWRRNQVENTLPILAREGRQVAGQCADPILARQVHEITTSLHNEMLTKFDRATMAWGIEGRVPLLDHRLVELALRLPVEERLATSEEKVLLRRVARRHVPPAAVDRPKLGFNVPVSDWLSGNLAQLVEDSLSPDSLRRAGVFDPTTVKRLLAHASDHPGFENTHAVFTLLCFQVWQDGQATATNRLQP